MAPRDTPPFRADHVGSLLRPPELLTARADHAAGRIPAEALRAQQAADVVGPERRRGPRAHAASSGMTGSSRCDGCSVS